VTARDLFRDLFVEPFIEHQGERRALWLCRPRPVGGRLLLAPAGRPLPEAAARGRVAVLLSRGRAFGTGGHGSTQGCLFALEERLRPGQTVLDVGTGTGVLALAAAALGAGRVVAVDVSLAACREARRNAALNGFAPVIAVAAGSADAVSARFHVVLANLRTPILAALLPLLEERLREDGTAILSGILERELPSFARLLEDRRLRPDGLRVLGGWATLCARRDAPARGRTAGDGAGLRLEKPADSR